MAQQTKAAVKPAQQLPEEQDRGAVAIFQPPRLDWHPAIGERFGIDKSGWKVLTEATFPAAKTTDAVVMALAYCRARKLDVFKKPVHIVPMWSSQAKTYVETVWPSIGELRTTAFRTGQYVGCDETDFGPDVTKTFNGRIKSGNAWEDASATVTFPEWARITVRRILNGVVCVFVGPKVYWLESYARRGPSDLPNDMWCTRPRGQLEKCAEAAALRKAFPEELGNEYAAEEMEGRVMQDVTPAADMPQASGSAATRPQRSDFQKTEDPEATEQPDDAAGQQQEDADTAGEQGDELDVGALLDNMLEELAYCQNAQDVADMVEARADSIALLKGDHLTRWDQAVAEKEQPAQTKAK